MSVTRLFAVVSLVCVTVVGCKRNDESSRGDVSSPRVQSSSSVAADSIASANRELVSPNTVRYADGFLTINVHKASLDELLRRIAKSARFRLEMNHVERQPFDIFLRHVSLEEALRVILGEIPYKLSYENIDPGPVQKIAYLRVGIPTALAQADVSTIARQKLEMAKRNLRSNAAGGSLTREQLSALTGAERLERLSQLPPSSENMPLLLDVLRHDKQSDMKIAAMAALENSDTPEAIGALQESLSESDTAVVLAAIDSIEFAGDNTQIPALAKLLQHPNSEVREAAAEAIDFLR